jgi:hypothetical protein
MMLNIELISHFVRLYSKDTNEIFILKNFYFYLFYFIETLINTNVRL